MKKTILTGLFLSLFLTFASFTSIAGANQSLITAAYTGNLDEVKHLIEYKNADINTKDSTGTTALMAASQIGNMDMVEFLVDCEAEVNAKDIYERTALILAALMNQEEVITYLVDNGAEVNIQDYEGVTALMRVAYHSNDNQAIVEHLVDKGAIVSIEANDGYTAFDWAELKCNAKISSYLMMQNPMMNAMND